MSSDGSVSSRLRQLGLYRSIDARTEEFLRLSRRRQIKQGCVCAAISTAVTVTVVICVILVYEYIIISQRSRHIAPSWRNLMNSSADTLPFYTEYDMINIDLTATKLLPRLLKTLSKNRFINEIITDSHDAAESYRKNIFLDVRKWVKVPVKPDSVKQFKSSLHLLFTSQTRNIDAYAKTKQLKRYKKIIKYMDEIIPKIPSEEIYRKPLTNSQENTDNYNYSKLLNKIIINCKC